MKYSATEKPLRKQLEKYSIRNDNEIKIAHQKISNKAVRGVEEKIYKTYRKQISKWKT